MPFEHALHYIHIFQLNCEGGGRMEGVLAAPTVISVKPADVSSPRARLKDAEVAGRMSELETSLLRARSADVLEHEGEEVNACAQWLCPAQDMHGLWERCASVPRVAFAGAECVFSDTAYNECRVMSRVRVGHIYALSVPPRLQSGVRRWYDAATWHPSTPRHPTGSPRASAAGV